jgi:ketosteroid isomerase-like protein
MESAEQLWALAKRFIDAVEAGDTETIEAIYAADATIWHNNDRLAQTRAENLKTLRSFIRFAPKRRYTERKVTPFPGGFVHQHVLVAETDKGKVLELACCLVCTVADGKITRLDEYLDSAPLAVWAS